MVGTWLVRGSESKAMCFVHCGMHNSHEPSEVSLTVWSRIAYRVARRTALITLQAQRLRDFATDRMERAMTSLLVINLKLSYGAWRKYKKLSAQHLSS